MIMDPYVPLRNSQVDNLIMQATNNVDDETIINAISTVKLQRQLRLKENKINTDFSTLFSKTQNKVVEAISEHYGFEDEIKDILKAEIGNLQKPMVVILENGLKDAINVGAKQSILDINKTGSNLSYTPFDPKVRELLQERATDAVEQSLNTITDQLMGRVADAYEQGWNSEKAAREIRSMMDGMKDKNLKTLTRTEMHSAKLEARQLRYLERGVEYTQWITAGDDLVRGNDPRDEADHVSMDGEITRTGEPFSNGLIYPGDMNGDISEWINCRCDYRPFVMPLGMEPPGEGPFFEEDLVEVEEKVSLSDL